MAPKILVIGLGAIGYHTAEYFSVKQLEVHGYDIYKPMNTRALKAGVIKQIAEDYTGYDCYVICVSTHNPKDMTKPDISSLMEVIGRIKRESDPGALICIDSTIPTGTSRMIAELVHPKLCVVHCPHRFYGQERHEHGVNQLRVLGGYADCCIEAGYDFYRSKAGINVHVAPSIEIAELSKLVENSYRYVQIAFAEELKMFCDKEGIDFNEMRSAANTKWNCAVMEARDGIGSHCLPKDVSMLSELINSDASLIKAAQRVDLAYRLHIHPPLPEIEK